MNRALGSIAGIRSTVLPSWLMVELYGHWTFFTFPTCTVLIVHWGQMGPIVVNWGQLGQIGPNGPKRGQRGSNGSKRGQDGPNGVKCPPPCSCIFLVTPTFEDSWFLLMCFHDRLMSVGLCLQIMKPYWMKLGRIMVLTLHNWVVIFLIERLFP